MLAGYGVMEIDYQSVNEQPIGLFDSGVGGLSVLKAMEARLPLENYIYFGDTARAPYGSRSEEEICRFNLEIGGWLLRQECKALLIACNTSTVLGMGTLKASTDKPIFGMMEATLSEVLPSVGPIGFIATQGTVNSGAYQKAFAAAAPDCPFYAQACPDLVPFVERGELDGAGVEAAIAAYIAPLQAKGVKTLVLGCTHYPYLAPVISSFLGAGVKLADPADALARIVEGFLGSEGMRNHGAGAHHGERAFYCSGDRERFQEVGGIMLGRELNPYQLDHLR